jgi:hypothetical protein
MNLVLSMKTASLVVCEVQKRLWTLGGQAKGVSVYITARTGESDNGTAGWSGEDRKYGES